MGLFHPPPPTPVPPTPTNGMAMFASACILTGATIAVYNAVRSDNLPTGGALKYQIAGFVVNVVSVSIPGRFDGDADPQKMDFPWPTLLSPAGFAFAIWGVIYLGEIAGMVALTTNGDVAAVAAPAARAWLCANVAQALWCASFRYWALDKLWLSSACLCATAASLVLSQTRLVAATTNAAAIKGGTTPHKLLTALVVWPRSLHAGWVTAASLVNINAWVGYAAIGPAKCLAVYVLSLVGATSLSTWYARSGLVCAALAVAWALFAVSKGVPVGPDAAALGATTLDGLATASAAVAALITAIAAAGPM